MSDDKLRLLVLGAHPDDAEVHTGGLMAMYRQLGHSVKIVSVTNGAAGHHQRTPGELTEIRRGEAAAVARLIGAEYEIWEYPDGELQSTLELRRRIIREIRGVAPDLVLTHRTNDYHPDHRAVGQVVQDASFTVTVPLIVPDTTALRKDPLIAYMTDSFTKPNPLTADVVIDIEDQFETIVDMVHCHRSQVYEWLPYLDGTSDQVPQSEAGQREFLAQWLATRFTSTADRFRQELIGTYGQQHGSKVRFAEAYEISEYATKLDESNRDRLFPGVP